MLRYTTRTAATFACLLQLGGCNSDDLGDIPEPELPPGCAGIPQSGDSAGGSEGEYEFEIGQVHECSGTRKARINVKLCTGVFPAPACSITQPVHEYVPPFESEPIVEEELLEVEQAFGPLDGNPPPTAACCTETTSEEDVKATALVDCAARSCLEVHDQIVVLKNVLQTEFDSLGGGVKKNALGRALVSLVFYAQHLEMPTGFKACTNSLHGLGQYTLPDPDNTGIGALRDFGISSFECVDIECVAKEPEDPTTGGGAGSDTCTQNPNWFEGNAGEAAFGAGVPESGSLTLTLGGDETQPAFQGVSIAYERLAACQGPVCPFALTDLRFTLADVSVGLLTLQAPSVFLHQVAFGAQNDDEVTIGDGELVLRVESAITFAGQPFLNGAVIPLFVANSGKAKLRMVDESLEVKHAHFELMFGASAHLAIAATACSEE